MNVNQDWKCVLSLSAETFYKVFCTEFMFGGCDPSTLYRQYARWVSGSQHQIGGKRLTQA